MFGLHAQAGAAAAGGDASSMQWAPQQQAIRTDPATGEPIAGDELNGVAAAMVSSSPGGLHAFRDPNGRGSPPLTPVQPQPAATDAETPRVTWGAAQPGGAGWRPIPQPAAAAQQRSAGKAKRKRTPVEGTDECTALQAYEEVCRTCCRAVAPPGPASQLSNLFWVLPYDKSVSQPQLVVTIERYVLPNRNLRHTVFNDAGFLARIVHIQTAMQGVPGEEGDGVGGQVLVTPSNPEGYLRLTWPTKLVADLLDELLRRSRPCVEPTMALEGRHDTASPDEEDLRKRMCNSLSLVSPAQQRQPQPQPQQGFPPQHQPQQPAFPAAAQPQQPQGFAPRQEPQPADDGDGMQMSQ